MCGITGLVRYRDSVNKEEVARMTSVLTHRGPDGFGLWCQNGVGIGHRRLSIIDIESGRQPMSNEIDTIWITYNGELYNYKELRDDLICFGHTFKSRSDTEVIIHAYEQWGDACVERFRGMFAFAIVDTDKRRVFLARDHLGIKPLVYYIDQNCFAFSSEIQALRQVQGARFDLDLQSIDQYLCLQYIPAPRTVFRKVSKLPPAHRFSVSFDGTISNPEQYWRVSFKPSTCRRKSEWIEELDFVLRESVKSHLVSDVPFGAFLSGGVDSSAVVAYMAQILDQPVKTFSIGFHEHEFNELEFARTAARRWNTDHYDSVVKPDALKILPDLVKNYGEPFGDSSAVPTYYVSKIAREHVHMVLSGDGGDEAFAGYNSYRSWMNLIEGRLPLLRNCLAALRKNVYFLETPNYVHNNSLDIWITLINYMSTPLRTSLWRKDYHSTTIKPLDLFIRLYDQTSGFSNAQKVQYMDMHTYLPYDILTKVDVASMTHGLEVRTPFVDTKVIEFAATIPQSINIRRCFGRGWDGKLLLKELMERYYPRDFLYRKKMGFGVPIQKWLTEGGSLHRDVRERLIGPNTMIAEYFEPSVTQTILDGNFSGRIWLLLFLEEWLQQNR